METFWKTVANLLKVKSLVTIVLAFQGRLETKDFYSVIVMVLTFYFGAQSAKKEGESQ